MAQLSIETSGLRKTYGAKVAVSDITLQVNQGEVFGFLGPNGAGKSTAVKMLLGLVKPTGGTALVLGKKPGSAAAMFQIGFLPEHFRFHEWMKASELLDLHAKLYGLNAEARRKRIPELLERVGLGDQAQRPVAGFSKGRLQRVGLAQALLSDPKLVFLDEPTSALDPFGRMLVRGIIRELRDAGTTVFLNSHLLSEVEATCDRVSFIRAGRILQSLSLNELEAEQLLVDMEVDFVTPALLTALEGLVVSEPRRVGVNAVGIEGGAGLRAVAKGERLELVLKNEDALPQVASRTIGSGAKLYAMTPRRRSLEQIFLDVVGQEDSGQ